MKYKFKLTPFFVLFIFCLSISLVFGQTEKYKALLGTWDVQTEDGSYEFIFEFSLQEETLTGIFTGSSGETDMENLTFEDNKLSFTVDINGMVIDFSATIDEGSLAGMLSLEYGETNISGEKRKE